MSPHETLLRKWLAIGSLRTPADDAAALEFIRETWGHRGYDAWKRENDSLPPFVLIAEGEPRRLMVGYLRFSTDDNPLHARLGTMAMLLALENLLKKEQRDIGVLIAADEILARRLAPVLPSLELLVDCVMSPDAPAVLPAVKRIAWRIKDAEKSPFAELAAEVKHFLVP